MLSCSIDSLCIWLYINKSPLAFAMSDDLPLTDADIMAEHEEFLRRCERYDSEYGDEDDAYDDPEDEGCIFGDCDPYAVNLPRALTSQGGGAVDWRDDPSIIGLITSDVMDHILRWLPFSVVAKMSKTNAVLHDAIGPYLQAERQKDPRAEVRRFMSDMVQPLRGALERVFLGGDKLYFGVGVERLRNGLPCILIEVHNRSRNEYIPFMEVVMQTVGRSWTPASPGPRWWIQLRLMAVNREQVQRLGNFDVYYRQQTPVQEHVNFFSVEASADEFSLLHGAGIIAMDADAAALGLFRTDAFSGGIGACLVELIGRLYGPG